MDHGQELDLDLYTRKEKIDINLKNATDGQLYELELVKKVKTSPTSSLFVFEYGEDIRNVIEVDIFSVFQFVGAHEKPTVPGCWNGAPLDPEDSIVRRKYTPIYINVDERQIHFLIRIYGQTAKFPDGGRFTRYLDNFVLTETVNITTWKSNFKLLRDNQIKALATKHEFETLNLAAGGTGITPFIRLLIRYQDLPFNINLIYCNRDSEEIMLKPFFDKLADINPRLKLTYLVSDTEDAPEGVLRGRINEDIVSQKFENSDKAVCLFCGPPGFNDLLFEILHKLKFKHVHRV